MPERKWLNIELKNSEAFAFRVFLISKTIKFETSGVGSLTHFECFMTDEERKEADDFLETLVNEK